MKHLGDATYVLGTGILGKISNKLFYLSQKYVAKGLQPLTHSIQRLNSPKITVIVTNADIAITIAKRRL